MATIHFGSRAAGALSQSVLLLHQQRAKRGCVRVRARASGGGGESSYLKMWKKAVERDRKNTHFNRIADRVASAYDGSVKEDLEKKTNEFQKLLEVSREERDRIQRMQVIDRASAAIAAARAILKEGNEADSNTGSDQQQQQQHGMETGNIFVPESETQRNGIPGPDFWSWTPPLDSDVPSDDNSGLQLDTNSSVYSTLSNPVAEKERSLEFLSIPFESLFSQSKHSSTLPALQSSLEVEPSASNMESPSLEEEQKRGALSSSHAAEAAHALNKANNSSPIGVNPDGSRWWKDTGIEQRSDGVICRWTMTRGVTADKAIQWQEKFWEAADEFGYKELGSEKSGRDANGNVWHEFWRESLREDNGLMHMEKTADKWGRNGKGDEWQEKWWEHYNASGQAEKWAHKWCSIDPNTPLEAGHAHVWHERWGETYDGYGGSTKYTDKWAERSEYGGWEKWGDKWDESFDLSGNGVKQGETWWEGKHGERWNRTWGEQHNGSGWIHKYGKSSSGEHWDTHVRQDTWYERFPHYGFFHCYENSVQLREVPKPSEIQEPNLPKLSEIQEP
ncbi:protein LIKE EARLY STARVATION, chloroplastic isoform X2 [Gastrolobium bilobum]|uniref:protein LIKE EARLY STARVATION, chloroplastic isoform X2 n=1 Tax=Gastrolobium bilobum TaxID=150636 RepID=UPI002AAF51D3|nr:protein LIKE EARLY STARVATION, chloroplastic isoform X2 [Gastrolobium bilobum]